VTCDRRKSLSLFSQKSISHFDAETWWRGVAEAAITPRPAIPIILVQQAIVKGRAQASADIEMLGKFEGKLVGPPIR